MFCIQCEQTLQNDRSTGCQFKKGMCGKEADTADLQDLLIYMLQGISQYAHRARALGVINQDVDRFIPQALFTTLTNVNFDSDRFVELVTTACALRGQIREQYEAACKAQGKTPEQPQGPAQFQPASDKAGLLAQAGVASLRNKDVDPDVFGLRALLLYGLKGCGAYSEHAQMLNKEDPEVYAGFHQFLSFLAESPVDIGDLLNACLEAGKLNLRIMELLDSGNTGMFGHPAPSQVRTTPIKGKAILVSGHDMVDLYHLLQQTAGKDINVYTHGELLPAHAYPVLKAFPHLVGNYGGAWQDQQAEFAAFPGAILMTSNCLLDPNVGGYGERIFTCGPTGWPGVRHIQSRDFTPVIEAAQQCHGFEHDQIERFVTVGFARNAVLGVADKVIEAVKGGAIRHFFLIGGCDGAKSGRNYYTEFAEHVPEDCVILTVGCGKYRFNQDIHGDIGGIPRLLDIGQCNDSYSALQIAMALANAFECGVNDLPLTLVISWFEQKAAAVLLTLLALGVENIHLGPTLPAYLTPNLVSVLVDKFKLRAIGDAEEDLKRILKVS